jgi:cytochrome c oxidase subunit III
MPRTAMHEVSLPHEFQYSSASHQAQSAIAGTWLFLATEVLFFGALFLAWIYARHFDQAGFDAGAQHTSLQIGTINTLILITSSFVYSAGVVSIESGNSRRLIHCCAAAALLGLSFLILKFGIEWRDDFSQHLFPGPGFAIEGPLRGGARLFFVFYFFGTAIHGLHMVVGVALVGWIILRTGQGAFSSSYYTPVAVVGLYWSFVDMVWLILYPLIYLVGRST